MCFHDFSFLITARYATAAQTLSNFHRLNSSAPQMRYERKFEYLCKPSHLSCSHMVWIGQSFIGQVGFAKKYRV
jgi:hypothetical protein